MGCNSFLFVFCCPGQTLPAVAFVVPGRIASASGSMTLTGLARFDENFHTITGYFSNFMLYSSLFLSPFPLAGQVAGGLTKELCLENYYNKLLCFPRIWLICGTLLAPSQ